MAALTLLLFAGEICGGLAFNTNTPRAPQQQVPHTGNDEGIFTYCHQPSLSGALQWGSKTAKCAHMLSSVSHCVWSSGKDVCLASGSQCEPMTGDSLAPLRNHEPVNPGVWRKLAELLMKEVSGGEIVANHSFKYRRACVSDGNGSVTVGCDVEEVTNQTSIYKRDAIIFLRPESRSWVAEFSLELNECDQSDVIRGLKYLSDKDLKGVNTSQWLQVEFTHSRRFTLHVYSITIQGLAGRSSVSETQCRGFKRYNVVVRNVSLWRDTCWRDKHATTVTTALLCVSVATTSLAVIVAIYALCLTLEGKTLLQDMDMH